MPAPKPRPTPAKRAASTTLGRAALKTSGRTRVTAQTTKPVEAPSAPNATSGKNKSFAVADARAKLSEIFEYVTSQQARCFVRAGDPKKTKFITFDYKERYMVEPIMDISLNELKRYFSTYSTFVRLGMCFRISRRTSNQPIFMRRFTSYVEPLEAVLADYVERRTRKAVEEALNARSESGIEQALLTLRHAQENGAAEMMAEIKRVSTGIGRMAVNRHPFRDVPLRKNVIVVGDDDE